MTLEEFISSWTANRKTLFVFDSTAKDDITEAMVNGTTSAEALCDRTGRAPIFGLWLNYNSHKSSSYLRSEYLATTVSSFYPVDEGIIVIISENEVMQNFNLHK